MTKEQANKIIDENNAAIDNYMANILPEELEKAGYPVINGKIQAGGLVYCAEYHTQSRAVCEKHSNLAPVKKCRF